MHGAINHTQAAQLLGKKFLIEGRLLQFGSRERRYHAGGEAIAFPMLDANGTVVGYARFLDSAKHYLHTEARLHRTEWLLGQGLHRHLDALAGAPQSWVSTRSAGRPAGVNFDFTGVYMQAAVGESWRQIKSAADRPDHRHRPLPPNKVRVRAAKNFLATLAALEAVGFMHGDLSDRNLFVDVDSGRVSLIDFDQFVCRSPTLRFPAMSLANGGLIGTPGYCPPELEAAGVPHAHPIGDRHARDMLLLELLAFQEGDPPDLPPSMWSRREAIASAVRRVSRNARFSLQHLQNRSVFTAPESRRPSAAELAQQLRIVIPTLTNLDAAPVSAPRAGVPRDNKDSPSQPRPQPIVHAVPKSESPPQPTRGHPSQAGDWLETMASVRKICGELGGTLVMLIAVGFLIMLFSFILLIPVGVPAGMFVFTALRSLFFSSVATDELPSWLYWIAIVAALASTLSTAIFCARRGLP